MISSGPISERISGVTIGLSLSSSGIEAKDRVDVGDPPGPARMSLGFETAGRDRSISLVAVVVGDVGVAEFLLDFDVD